MRPTTAFNDNVFDINALLHPGTVFDHPKDVLAHSSLSISEKRAILASWASDAAAVASNPALSNTSSGRMRSAAFSRLASGSGPQDICTRPMRYFKAVGIVLVRPQ